MAIDNGGLTLLALTDAKYVERAIAEFHRVGRKAFLRKYGFKPARDYFLRWNGFDYDSKAIAGAAVGYEHPDHGPLKYTQFSGGITVQERLAELGLNVHTPNKPNVPREPAPAPLTSTRFLEGEVYTREDLRALFRISDMTLNNGVFQQKGTSSIWLFVTERKQKDRTQYDDRLLDDVLTWQGQSAGGTDQIVIEHQLRELELLVFYRREKYQFRGAGFRYLGPFEYVTHKGNSPATFTLRRSSSDEIAAVPGTPQVDPTSLADARTKITREISQRRGQGKFRSALLKAYGRCCVTGCSAKSVLEAAHIHPYRGETTNVVSNGLLLRSDIHTLFDLFLLGVEPRTGKIVLAPSLRKSEYKVYAGKPLLKPTHPGDAPGKAVLQWHLDQMNL